MLDMLFLNVFYEVWCFFNNGFPSIFLSGLRLVCTELFTFVCILFGLKFAAFVWFDLFSENLVEQSFRSLLKIK